MIKRRYRVEISVDECKGCGRCVLACPKDILKLGSQLNAMAYPAVTVISDGCIGCGGCFYSCPEPGAITIYEVENE